MKERIYITKTIKAGLTPAMGRLKLRREGCGRLTAVDVLALCQKMQRSAAAKRPSRPPVTRDYEAFGFWQCVIGTHKAARYRGEEISFPARERSQCRTINKSATQCPTVDKQCHATCTFKAPQADETPCLHQSSSMLLSRLS